MEAINNEALVEAFMKSNKTLEETIAFLESDIKVEEEETKPASRRGRKRKASHSCMWDKEIHYSLVKICCPTL
ncbi:MAG: hypothetical protein ACI4FV_11250 [Lachnospiraceae bacterium]